MSKFWGGTVSESESEAESDGGEQVHNLTQAAAAAATASRKTDRAWAAVEDSSSDESQRRVVKTEKDKRFEHLKECTKVIEAHKRDNAHVDLKDDFDSLMKQYQKAESLILAEGAPAFFYSCILNLQTYVDAKCRDKEGLKKLSKAKATALNRLKASIPKATAEFKDALAAYAESRKKRIAGGGAESASDDESSDDDDKPGESDGESLSESSGSENEGPVSSSKKQAAKKRRESSSASSSASGDRDGSDSESSSAGLDDDSDLSGSSSASSSSSESEAEDGDDAGYESKHRKAMIKWGLKEKTPEEEQEEREKEKNRKDKAALAKVAVAEKLKAKKKIQEENAATAVEMRRASVIFGENEPITPETVLAKVKDIGATRSKKRGDKLEQIKVLKVLASLADEKLHDLEISLEIHSQLIMLSFDVGSQPGTPWSPIAVKDLLRYMDKMLGIFLQDPSLRFTYTMPVLSGMVGALESLIFNATTATTTTANQSSSAQQSLSSVNPAVLAEKESAMTVSVVSSFVDRADDILAKCLQSVEQQCKDFRDLLGVTIDAIAVLWKAFVYFNRMSQLHPTAADAPHEELHRVTLRLLEHTYYSPDAQAIPKWTLVTRRLAGSVGGSVALECLPVELLQKTPSQFVYQLAEKVFFSAPQQMQGNRSLRALLQVVYCKAIHDDYFGAKDLFTAPNLQDFAWNAEISDQVLYNRCVAQVGLAATRLGHIQDGLSCLAEVCGMNRQRELLAQGVAVVKGVEKTVEQEKAERRRLLPVHMHINLDVLECSYNICAMLIEIPQIAAGATVAGYDPQKPRVQSSRFRRMFETFEKSTTPPENPREHLMAAGKALQGGNWQLCEEIVMGLKFWESVVPETRRVQVQKMLCEKIKEESLRTYLLTHAKIYSSISVDQLSKIFGLDRPKVHRVVAKMMLGGEIPALWDENSDHVVINKVEPSRIQVGAMKMVEKISSALESCEIAAGIRKVQQQNRPPRTNRVDAMMQ